MRYIVMILVILNCSCQSTKKTSSMTPNTEDIFLSYSKTRCLGKCAVYNIRIYQDGSMIYEGLEHVKIKGKLKRLLERQELEELKAGLNRVVLKDSSFRKIRDKPVTTLKYNGKKYQYHSTHIKGDLKNIDLAIEKLVQNMTSNP